MQAVAEAYRNISACGATPLAVTNNLNFGNPEKPLIMGQITGAVTGMGEAAKALSTPIVSGNVSLYNETGGQAINPAPVIGMIGVIDNVADAVNTALSKAGDHIFIVGQSQDCADGWLGASIYADVLTPNPDAAPPPVSLQDEARHGGFIRTQIISKAVSACHDISDGGILAALSDMAIAARELGAEITLPKEAGHGWAFGEDQGRYIITCADASAFTEAANTANVAVQNIGVVISSEELKLSSGDIISVEEMRRAYEDWLPALMAKAQ
jgi:phosphoribosylformylglycinamidine synthase